MNKTTAKLFAEYEKSMQADEEREIAASTMAEMYGIDKNEAIHRYNAIANRKPYLVRWANSVPRENPWTTTISIGVITMMTSIIPWLIYGLNGNVVALWFAISLHGLLILTAISEVGYITYKEWESRQ